MVFALRGDLEKSAAAAFVGVQIAAGILGVWMAHLMFGGSASEYAAPIGFIAIQNAAFGMSGQGIMGFGAGCIQIYPKAMCASIQMVSCKFQNVCSVSFYGGADAPI